MEAKMFVALFLVLAVVGAGSNRVQRYAQFGNLDEECDCAFSSRARRNCVLEDDNVVHYYRHCAKEKKILVPFWLREKVPEANHGACYTEADIDQWEQGNAAKLCWSVCVWSKLGLMGHDGFVDPNAFIEYAESQAEGNQFKMRPEEKTNLYNCIKSNSTLASGQNECKAAWDAHMCFWTTFWSRPTLSCMESYCKNLKDN